MSVRDERSTAKVRSGRRTVVFDENPKPPLHEFIHCDPPRIAVGAKADPAFLVTSGRFVIYEIHGEKATLTEAVECVLHRYHCDEAWKAECVIWRGCRVRAIVRFVPFDGRRVVYFFDGMKVEREVYPPHRDFKPPVD